jgi:3-oxoacyl-[acyl-carrier-protein] synthase-3
MSFDIHAIENSFPKKKTISKDIKITKYTGIKKRYISSVNEDVLTLSINSLKKIFKKNEPDKIDFLLVVTQTSPYRFPSLSCIIQDRLNLRKNIFALDINMGCSGFIYALHLADSLFEKNKIFKNGIIVCSDTYTKFISKNNNSCGPIFSDGASSVLLKRNHKKIYKPYDFGVDGSGSKNLFLRGSEKDMFMNGAQVALFTLNVIPKFINNFLNKNLINKKEIKLYAFHQASKFVCENLKKKLDLTDKQVFFNYNKFGNMVSASIPILLKEADKKNLIKKDDKVLLCGFGVGLSWGATILNWKKLKK